MQSSIQIISTPDRIRQQYLNVIRTASSDIFLVFPTINAIHREHKIGIIEELKKAVERGVKIRILTAEDEFIKDKFVNIAAHELRNPIMPILSGADLIQEGIAQIQGSIDKDKFADLISNVQLVVRNASKLLKLSEDILQVSRIESGTFRINLEPVAIEPLIRSTIVDVEKRYLGEKRNTKIVLESNLEMTNDNEGPEGFTMYCDGPKVAQTLFNLLDNAMKFTGQGNIIVSAIAHDTEVIIQVQDPGIGIDPEIKDRLFEKFATKSTGGTGLGLYLSKKIIEAHGGRIWCKDNEKTKGTDSGFTIPLDLQPETTVMLEKELNSSNAH